jgi:monoamine oxidase
MFYDYVIVGGGISGLYLAYELLKMKGPCKLILLEKGTRLGGRVFTYSDSYMTVDTGAGRFNEKHLLFMKLLKELGLDDKKIKNGNSAAHYYIDVHGNSHFMNSILDFGSTDSTTISTDSINTENLQFSRKGFIQPIEDMTLDIWQGKEVLPNVGIIVRLIVASKLVSKTRLISMSFVTFAKTVLSKEELDFLLGSFGYYSELVLMNAYDCLHLIMELDPKNQFYSLSGGLSLVIRELEKRILKMGGILHTRKHVTHIHDIHIHEISDSISAYEVSGKNFSYKGTHLICALTKQAISSLSFFRPILPLIQKIKSAPLCRIYAKYPVSKKNGVWFRGLSKFTVNNELRMVIPISEKDGVIMIAYMDNKYAEFWQAIFEKGGEKGLHQELKRLISLTTNIDIPDAIEVRAFYWEYGVGYWGPGADSEKISELIAHPFADKKVYICNENFSSKFQQWMEGSLDSASRVLHFL